MKIQVRWMIRRDMPEVLGIERDFPDAWTEETFLQCLRHRNCIGMVAEQGDKVVGFMIYELRSRSFYLLNFGVDGTLPMHRAFRVASALVRKLRRKLHRNRRYRIAIDVRESDIAIQHALSHLRFKAVNVIRGHFQSEDAYRFAYTIKEKT